MDKAANVQQQRRSAHEYIDSSAEEVAQSSAVVRAAVSLAELLHSLTLPSEAPLLGTSALPRVTSAMATAWSAWKQLQISTSLREQPSHSEPFSKRTQTHPPTHHRDTLTPRLPSTPWAPFWRDLRARLTNTPLTLDAPPQVLMEDFLTPAPLLVPPPALPHSANGVEAMSAQALKPNSSAGRRANADTFEAPKAGGLFSLMQVALLVLELSAPTGSVQADFCRVYHSVVMMANIASDLLPAAGFVSQTTSLQYQLFLFAIAFAGTIWRHRTTFRIVQVRNAEEHVRGPDPRTPEIQMVNAGTMTAEEPVSMIKPPVQATEKTSDSERFKKLKEDNKAMETALKASDRQLKIAKELSECTSLELRMQRPRTDKAVKDSKALQLKYDEQTTKYHGLEAKIIELETSLRETTNALDRKEDLSSKLDAQTKECQDLEGEVARIKDTLDEMSRALIFKDEEMSAMSSNHSQKVANLARKNIAKNQALRRKAREASQTTAQLNEKSKTLIALQEAMALSATTQSSHGRTARELSKAKKSLQRKSKVFYKEVTKHADLPRQYQQLKADHNKLSREEAAQYQKILNHEKKHKTLDARIEEESRKNEKLQHDNEKLSSEVQTLSATKSDISSQLSGKSEELAQEKQMLKQLTSQNATKASIMQKVKKILMENFDISGSAAHDLLEHGDLKYDDKLAVMQRKKYDVVRKKVAHILVKKFNLSEQDAAFLLEKGELVEQKDEEDSKDSKDAGDREPRDKDEDDDDHNDGQAPNFQTLEQKAAVPATISRPGDDADARDAHSSGDNDAGELGDAVHDDVATQMEDISFESSEVLGGNDKLHANNPELEDEDNFSAMDTNDTFANQPDSQEQSMEGISFDSREALSGNEKLHASNPELEDEVGDIQMHDLDVHDAQQHVGDDDDEDPVGDLERAFAMDTDTEDSGNPSDQLVVAAPATSLEIADNKSETVNKSDPSTSTQVQDLSTTTATLPNSNVHKPAAGTVRRAPAKTSIFFKPYKAAKAPHNRFKTEMSGDQQKSDHGRLGDGGLNVKEHESYAENGMNESIASSAGPSQPASLPGVSIPRTTSIGQRPVDLNLGTSSTPNQDFKTASGPPIPDLVRSENSRHSPSNDVTPLNAPNPPTHSTSGSVNVNADVQMSAKDDSVDRTYVLMVENFPRGTTEDRITIVTSGKIDGLLRCEILSTEPTVTAFVTFGDFSSAFDALSATDNAPEGKHKLSAQWVEPEEVEQKRQQIARRQARSIAEANGAEVHRDPATQGDNGQGKRDKGKKKQNAQNDMIDEIESEQDEDQPSIVIAKNFASDDTEEKIEWNMRRHGWRVLSCKILATEPLVTAEIIFGCKRHAKEAVVKCNGKNYVGNKLEFYQTDREGVKRAKKDTIAARVKLGGNKIRRLQDKRATLVGSEGEQTPPDTASTAAHTPVTSPASTAAPPQASAGTLDNGVCYWKKHDTDANGNITATYPCSNGPQCMGNPAMYDATGVVPSPADVKGHVWLYGGVSENSNRGVLCVLESPSEISTFHALMICKCEYHARRTTWNCDEEQRPYGSSSEAIRRRRHLWQHQTESQPRKLFSDDGKCSEWRCQMCFELQFRVPSERKSTHLDQKLFSDNGNYSSERSSRIMASAQDRDVRCLCEDQLPPRPYGLVAARELELFYRWRNQKVYNQSTLSEICIPPCSTDSHVNF
ncbi:uncharacterized protein MYCFIDRAFT_174277 [Pseudocercospora fijiensis CIRAD86]|uniref:RRM domain-containing protein n=1 Tax=Pseudocercospora fijiensis (strain CIRAD86) TaxID=383855 RepID=M2YYK6_PSEFD|nr:uncharacterized protein MYCFIDRAFT_174277 [Pseudocercospora fijiensis CIRAD86]EME82720.1 hypothetical protein MYCFIDRAFT_174277 [Pseudocercospora fijiensis CIRAD86]